MLYNSKIRTIIKEILLNTYTHPTAEDIYLMLINKGIKTSVSTVYRNLHQLSSEKEIKEIVMPTGKTHFDGQMKNHHHAQCIKCEKIFDIDVNNDLFENITNSIGMDIIDTNLIIKGICSNCKSK